jgi:hypothetical protein
MLRPQLGRSSFFRPARHISMMYLGAAYGANCLRPQGEVSCTLGVELLFCYGRVGD